MPVLTKLVYDDGVGPLGVLSVRFSLAAVLLLALARWRGAALPRGRQLRNLLLFGGIGYVTQSLCYFGALTRISAGLTALLLYLYPALVVLLVSAVHRTRPTRLAAGCVVAATAGTVLTIGPVHGGQWSGVLLGMGSAAAYTVYIVFSSRQSRGLGPLATSAVVISGCAVTYDVLAVGGQAALPSHLSSWTALVGVAVLSTVVAVSTFFAAVALLGPADTAVLSTFEPVVSVVVAALVLGEALTPLQLVGGAVVLGAVVALARQPTAEPVLTPA